MPVLPLSDTGGGTETLGMGKGKGGWRLVFLGISLTYEVVIQGTASQFRQAVRSFPCFFCVTLGKLTPLSESLVSVDQG